LKEGPLLDYFDLHFVSIYGMFIDTSSIIDIGVVNVFVMIRSRLIEEDFMNLREL